jgi:hypothetical protein
MLSLRQRIIIEKWWENLFVLRIAGKKLGDFNKLLNRRTFSFGNVFSTLFFIYKISFSLFSYSVSYFLNTQSDNELFVRRLLQRIIQ